MHAVTVDSQAATMGLTEILHPFDVSSFLQEYLSKTFLCVPGSPGKFAELLTWQMLNDILALHDLSNHIRLAKDASVVGPGSYLKYKHRKTGEARGVIRGAALIAQLREGATLIIDALDEICEPVRALAGRLEELFRTRVQINMYASWRSSRGFDLHWDDHDVIVLQITGKKQWQVYEQTTRFPLDRVDRDHEPVKPPKSLPVWTDILRDGDCLYIPRGWWHVVTPCDEPTIHLTVGIHQPVGLNILQWIVESLRSEELIRMDIPRFAIGDVQTEYISKIRTKMLELFDRPNLLKLFCDDMSAVAVPRSLFGLPWIATPGLLPPSDRWVITVLAPQGLNVETVEGESIIALNFDGNQFRFNDITLPLFSFLAGHAPLQIALFYEHFSSSFTREQLVEFISDLAQYGVIVLTEPE
jgi:Cupin superfamily protein